MGNIAKTIACQWTVTRIKVTKWSWIVFKLYQKTVEMMDFMKYDVWMLWNFYQRHQKQPKFVFWTELWNLTFSCGDLFLMASIAHILGNTTESFSIRVNRLLNYLKLWKSEFLAQDLLKKFWKQVTFMYARFEHSGRVDLRMETYFWRLIMDRFIKIQLNHLEYQSADTLKI